MSKTKPKHRQVRSNNPSYSVSGQRKQPLVFSALYTPAPGVNSELDSKPTKDS